MGKGPRRRASAVDAWEDKVVAKQRREVVENALEEIGSPDKVPRQHRATKYCLVARGRHWSAKYVVGRAWKYATGEASPHAQHSGGKSGAHLELQRLGYTVEACPAARRH